MKLKNYILLILILLSARSEAQDLIGLQGGVTWSNVAAAEFPIQTDFTFGMTVGGQYIHPFNNGFYLGLGGLYQERGYQIEVQFTDELGNPLDKDIFQNKFHYAAMSFMAGYRTDNRLGLFVEGGIVSGLLFRVTASTTKTVVVRDDELIIEDKKTRTKQSLEGFQTWDVGMAVKCGILYNLNENMRLKFSMGLQYSFTSYAKDVNFYHYLVPAMIGAEFPI